MRGAGVQAGAPRSGGGAQRRALTRASTRARCASDDDLRVFHSTHRFCGRPESLNERGTPLGSRRSADGLPVLAAEPGRAGQHLPTAPEDELRVLRHRTGRAVHGVDGVLGHRGPRLLEITRLAIPRARRRCCRNSRQYPAHLAALEPRVDPAHGGWVPEPPRYQRADARTVTRTSQWSFRCCRPQTTRKLFMNLVLCEANGSCSLVRPLFSERESTGSAYALHRQPLSSLTAIPKARGCSAPLDERNLRRSLRLSSLGTVLIAIPSGLILFRHDIFTKG